MIKLEELSERQLLELILVNQVTLKQWMYRVNAFLIGKYGSEFTDHGKQKIEVYDDMERHREDFINQYKEIVEEENGEGGFSRMKPFKIMDTRNE